MDFLIEKINTIKQLPSFNCYLGCSKGNAQALGKKRGTFTAQQSLCETQLLTFYVENGKRIKNKSQERGCISPCHHQISLSGFGFESSTLTAYRSTKYQALKYYWMWAEWWKPSNTRQSHAVFGVNIVLPLASIFLSSQPKASWSPCPRHVSPQTAEQNRQWSAYCSLVGKQKNQLSIPV